MAALTGVRGVAAMWVVLYHCFFALGRFDPRINPQPSVIGVGYLGVDLFFILSGYVLMLGYGLGFATHARLTLARFAVGRIARILPLYYAVMLALLLLSRHHPGPWLTQEPHTLRTFVLDLTLAQLWVGQGSTWDTPAWSLSAEWGVYLLFPALCLVARRLTRANVALLMAVLMLVALIAVIARSELATLNHVKRIGLVRCLTEFAAGVLLCRCVQLDAARLSGPTFLVVGAVLLVVSVAGAPFDLAGPFACLCLIAACALRSRVATALFGNRPITLLGEISFSIYLVHWPLLEAITAFTHDATTRTLGFAIMPLAVMPLAYLTWRWIEVPGQALGRLAMRRLTPRRAA